MSALPVAAAQERNSRKLSTVSKGMVICRAPGFRAFLLTLGCSVLRFGIDLPRPPAVEKGAGRIIQEIFLIEPVN
jgi:hypothetical protein